MYSYIAIGDAYLQFTVVLNDGGGGDGVQSRAESSTRRRNLMSAPKFNVSPQSFNEYP